MNTPRHRIEKAVPPPPARPRTVPCPRCAKHVPIDMSTGNWIPHDGQVKGNGSKKMKETPCKASGVQGAVVKPDGSIRLRDKNDVADDIDRRLGVTPRRKRKGSAGDPEVTSKSVRTVSGGLPGLGKRR